jgi:hypothetical protein
VRHRENEIRHCIRFAYLIHSCAGDFSEAGGTGVNLLHERPRNGRAAWGQWPFRSIYARKSPASGAFRDDFNLVWNGILPSFVVRRRARDFTVARLVIYLLDASPRNRRRTTGSVPLALTRIRKVVIFTSRLLGSRIFQLGTLVRRF